MQLYTCGMTKRDFPGPLKGHPCAAAIRALDRSGHAYELKKVEGYRGVPGTSKGPLRDEVERLSGQRLVPILVLDDQTVISGAREVIDWAKANPAAG